MKTRTSDPVVCSHCNCYEPTLLELPCLCGQSDLICPGCLRLVADALEAGEPIPSAHAHWVELTKHHLPAIKTRN